MGSESAPSSHASIISIDPAVASQITGTTQATSLAGHSRTGSSPGKRTKTPESRGHTRNKSIPIAAEKNPTTSLRRAKNSTEVLRQRSNKSTKKSKKLETIPDTNTREGRNFTIGNVGTNGVLYLKPSAHQNASVHQHSTSPPTLVPFTAPADFPTKPATNENVRLLTQPSRSESPSTARATSPKRSMTKATRRPTIETVRSRQGRSQSFSTAGDGRPSFGTGRSKTVKIIINRPEIVEAKQSHDASNEARKLAFPSLEVPIPHYRIGTPRFSDHGTPMLRSSAYSRDSANLSDVTAQLKSHGSGPPPSSARAFAKLGSDDRAKARPTTSDSANTDSTIREPIHPEIYDVLADVYDDPSVVRYSQNVREITAATPARIIAQISSESFMDYELVSDFFLTFRSYMSTFTVLDLLLARLRWAIDRQEDDGRIIRVRTFAALRHWILNYFLDDFMSDRRLRVRFCNEINQMYNDVASRSSLGTSDLKVLRDLKRCWNGRCSMYWDPTDFRLDGDQDEDLHPGGHDEFASNSILEADEPAYNDRIKTYSNSSWFEVPPTLATRPQDARQVSRGKQSSVASEQSLQAKSCSIPRNILRGSPTAGSPEGGSHPVPVQLRRKGPPASLEVKTADHHQVAAAMDSDPDPTPREMSATSLQLMQGASIIRGSVYVPSEPFVQIAASPTTPAISRFEVNNLQGNGVRRGGSANSIHAAGVKNIFGSLRKALAGRHGHSDMALVMVSSPIPIGPPQAVPRSAMPLNMSRSHDELRSKTPAPFQKGQIRIDLLCAQVSQNYNTLFPHMKRSDARSVLPYPVVVRPPGTADQIDPALSTPDLRMDRLPSHATAQSGSILIVNDTGLGMPTMSGGLYSPPQRFADPNHPPRPVSNNLQQLHFGLGIDRHRPSFAGATTQRSSDALGERVESNVDHSQEIAEALEAESEVLATSQDAVAVSPRNFASTAGSISTMRRVSYQSSVQAGAPQPSIDATATTVSGPNAEDHDGDDESITKIPAHALRRRPGGNLRTAENVHDLDQVVHHESISTTTTGAGSPLHSFMMMKDATKAPRAKTAQPPEKKQVSMINTHSSQHLRPSFEAAVSGFSDIPDDGDGGFEATLMKLEGTYENMSPPLEQHPTDTIQRRRSMPEITTRSLLCDDQLALERSVLAEDYVHVQGTDSDLAKKDISLEDLDEQGSSRKSSIFGLPVGSVDGSEDAYSPPPLLQRDTVFGPTSQSSGSKIMPSPLHLQKSFRTRPGDDLDQAEESRDNLTRPSQRPVTAADSNHSFLLDEDENLSDLSSEISVDIINYTHAADRSISPMLAAPGTALSGLEIPAHPLTYASVVNLAPPTERERESTLMRESQLIYNVNGVGQRMAPPTTVTRTSGGPAHIPFILACDSQVLAQQMTLIEKSALTEIDWSDLVERRWETNPQKILDWAEFLAKGDAQGVDLVVTRFNLVSKWVRSEIVLTQEIEERAQVIAKYIHVAAHARRLGNYATMVQITIGLTSSDVSRLSQTWSKVPEPDRSLIKHMERLVSPMRNFHELRQEIESADYSDGCIPFLGLYIRDLTYNAQKPAQIASKRGSQPLINFERFRTAAVIVKGLLRLIDAGSRYTFEPQKNIIERCLWLASLPEEKIYTLSRSLEH